MATVQCPTSDEINGFVDGRLSELRTEEIAEHFDHCNKCLNILSSIETASQEDEADPLANLIRKSAEAADSFQRDVAADAETSPGDKPDTVESRTGIQHPAESSLTSEDISNRYQILDELGQGGIGSISRARDSEIGRELAIKVLRKKHNDRPEVVQRFVEEAQIAGQLQHPGIVPVYEMGRCHDERPFFTMKLVNGQTLDQLLAASSRDPAQRQLLLNIFLQICHAVAFAHSKGVVHRDLKPVNIMIGEFGEVQVMDWGLAKLVGNRSGENEPGENDSVKDNSTGVPVSTLRDQPDALVSIDGSVLGTPAYMPPEQAQGNTRCVSKSSDVFALGAILLEMLTGKPPYSGASVDVVLDQAAKGDLRDAMERLDQASLDPELKQLIRHCLEKEPFDRPANAQQVARQIEQYLQSVESRLELARIEKTRADVLALNERRTRNLTVALVTTISAAILIGGFFWFSWQQEKQQQQLEDISQLKRSIAQAADMLQLAEASPDNFADQSKGVTALETADKIAQSSYVSTDLKEQTKQLLNRYASLESDRELFLELENLRQGPSIFDFERKGFDRTEIQSGYERVFRQLGIAPGEIDVDQAIELLRLKPDYLQQAAITGMDLWMLRISDKATRYYWYQIAQNLDTQSARKHVRQTIHGTQDSAIRDSLLANFDPREHSSDSIYALATHLRTIQQHESAIAILRQSVPHFPGDYWLPKTLGGLLIRQQPEQDEEIYRMFSIAAAIRPNNEAAQIDLLQGCIHSRRFEEAIVVGENLIQENPELATVYVSLATVHHRMKQFKLAEHRILTAIDLDPDSAAARSWYGNILAGLNRFPEAMEQHKLALQSDPNSFRSVCNLAAAYQAMGEAEKSMSKLKTAESHSLRAIELAPELAHGYYAHGTIIYTMAQIADAADQPRFYHRLVERMQQALQIRPSWSDAEFLLIIALGKLDRESEANPIATRLRENPRLTSHDLRMLAIYFKSGGRLNDAKQILARAVDAPGNTLQQKYQIAKSYCSVKAHRESRAVIQSVLENDPDNIEFLDLMAVNDYAEGDLDVARETWETIIDQNDYRTDIWKRLAGVYSRLDLHRELEEACVRIYKAEPTASRWLYDQANAISRQNRFNDAIVVYKKCLVLNPDHVQATINCAQAMMKAGRFEDARRDFELALELDDDRWAANVKQALKQLDRVEKVASQLGEVENGKRELSLVAERLEFARVSQTVGNHALALKLFRELISQPGNEALTRINLLKFYAARSAAALFEQQVLEDTSTDLDQGFGSIAYELIEAEFAQRELLVQNFTSQDLRRRYALLLRQWQTDPLLKSVREEASLARLEKKSAQQWRAFWEDVQTSFEQNW